MCFKKWISAVMLQDSLRDAAAHMPVQGEKRTTHFSPALPQRPTHKGNLWLPPSTLQQSVPWPRWAAWYTTSRWHRAMCFSLSYPPKPCILPRQVGGALQAGVQIPRGAVTVTEATLSPLDIDWRQGGGSTCALQRLICSVAPVPEPLTSSVILMCHTFEAQHLAPDDWMSLDSIHFSPRAGVQGGLPWDN